MKLEEKASKLLQSKMNLQACQLYRKAGNFLKAARLLFDVAAAESKKPVVRHYWDQRRALFEMGTEPKK